MNREGENVIIKAESETCKVAPLARFACERQIHERDGRRDGEDRAKPRSMPLWTQTHTAEIDRPAIWTRYVTVRLSVTVTRRRR
jgi:hypothetical protein